MSWMSFGEISRKMNPKYWDPQLAKAQEELWKGDLNAAGKSFSRIAKALESVKPKGLHDEILITKAETRLGLWAVGYLKNKQDGAGYRTILKGVQDTYQLWLFVAKTFILISDTSPDAIFAYQELLKRKPSIKNACAFVGILKKTEFSLAATELLEAAFNVLSFDIDSASWYCRWAIKSGHPEKAGRVAREILKRSPDHVEANRCLGYLAETTQQWSSARDYYQKSQDWLRQAVCCNHLGDYSKALDALMKVEQEKRRNSIWFYHAGWAYYRIGSLENARQCWHDLVAYFPQQHGHQLLSSVEERLYYQYLTNFSRPDHSIPEMMSEEYKNEVHLRQGAFQLMLNRDLESAEKNFQQISSKYPKSTLLSTYLLASKNFKGLDFSLDKTVFDQLKKENNDTSVYLLLCSLWLASSHPDVSLVYLDKASQEGILHHLPAKSLSGIQWLLLQSAKKYEIAVVKAKELLFLDAGIEQQDQDETPFCYAISSSFTAQKLQTDSTEVIPWITYSPKDEFISPVLWKKVQAVYYALHADWIHAIDVIQQEPFPELEEKLTSQGIYRSAIKREWQITADILGCALKKNPDDPASIKLASQIQGVMLQRNWGEHDYGLVEKQLQTILATSPGDSQIHHNLAILYTRLAIDQDQKKDIESSSHLWMRSIGHWAVVWSDDHYWKNWIKHRNQIYENGIDKETLNNLIDIQLPALLKNYFSERENQVNTRQADEYHYLTNLLEQELDSLPIIRKLVKQAEKSSLPDAILRWLSPVLVKEYGGEEFGKNLIIDLPRYKLSEAEKHQIHLAFSPLNEIHLLAESGQYELALNKLQEWQQKQEVGLVDLAQVDEERAFVLESLIHDLMKRTRWDEALKYSLDYWQLHPGHNAAEKLYVEVSLGWAKQRVQGKDYENAVNQLKRLRKRLSEVTLELDDQLAEAWTSWGWEALEEKQVSQAKDRFEEALGLDSANLMAREGLANVYISYVIEAEQKGDKKSAYGYAQEMYKYLQNEVTATIYARKSTLYALQLSESGMYQNAIGILNPALQLPYDRSEFQLEKLMSGILTDYGYYLFNSGQRSAGAEMTRQAVTLDSENSVAMQNLRIYRGW